MKINLKSIFGLKSADTSNTYIDNEEVKYDEHVDFYYTNLINSIILFSISSDELEKLREPTFDPIFELESEIDSAFTPVCFDTIFRNGLIDISLKTDLLELKKEIDNISSEIWDWEYLDNHPTWVSIRQKANELLDRLGVKNRIFNDDYITVYDYKGNILKKGKKAN